MITESSFKPIWYLRNPHLQTILANIVHPQPPQVTYEKLELSDGDYLQLAWGTARDRHTVLLLHGLEGSLRSAYAQRMINALNIRNIPVVMMFFRGCNGAPNRLLRSYHSGETGDLRAVIEHLKHKGVDRIALVGYSLGGNVTLKYLGEGRVDDSVACAAATSVPMLLDRCAERMNQGFSRLYQHTLLQRLKSKVAQKKELMAREGLPVDTSQIRNFVEFDDVYTAPIHGFTGAKQYYERCSSRGFIDRIETPTLIIHSRDDPFMTPDVIPAEHELGPGVHLELSAHGGHVGFITGKLKPRSWLEPRIIQFVSQHLSANVPMR